MKGQNSKIETRRVCATRVVIFKFQLPIFDPQCSPAFWLLTSDSCLLTSDSSLFMLPSLVRTL